MCSRHRKGVANQEPSNKRSSAHTRIYIIHHTYVRNNKLAYKYTQRHMPSAKLELCCTHAHPAPAQPAVYTPLAAGGTLHTPHTHALFQRTDLQAHINYNAANRQSRILVQLTMKLSSTAV